MVIKTSDTGKIKEIFKKINLPQAESHKGHNGKIMIIGGSSLFHAASLWAAEVACHFADMVHYASTPENEEIFLALKKIFRNGIIVPQKDLFHYVAEDDAILIGPGMMREGEEGKRAKNLTEDLIKKFPDKRFVFDAGAIQMMEADWLLDLKQKPIVTPHQKEFDQLFGISVIDKTLEEKEKIVKATAAKYHCVILLKAIVDIVSDGKESYIIDGGNAGLTKGGTGDVLSGLAVSFYAKQNALTSAIAASMTLKMTAEELFKSKGYWYNVSDIIKKLPEKFKEYRL